MAIAWTDPVGVVMTREQRKDKYGGSTMGGIEPSKLSDNVFVYSDPSRGTRHGYNFDGWDPDDELFLYTGDGRSGDQTMTGGNKSLAEHRQDGRTVRLFIAEGVVPGTQTKTHVYIGEFTVDPALPFTRERAPGEDKIERDVYVWRLRPVGDDYLHRDADLSDVATIKPSEAESVNVPLEQSTSNTFEVAATDRRTAQKREKALVDRYVETLTAAGRQVMRRRIKPAGQLVSLFTDLYDLTAGELYEAKGTARRDDVRMAIGQLFDYRRRLPTDTRLSVLLPSRPSDDVLDLIHSVGFSCVHDHDGDFVRLDP